VILDGTFWGSVGGRLAASGTGAAPDGVVLAIKVPDVDGEYARLRREGIAIESPPADRPQMGLRNLMLRDPDGNAVELYSDLRRPPPA
jgi:predicted enzyme related to lactoylglutathione lyase